MLGRRVTNKGGEMDEKLVCSAGGLPIKEAKWMKNWYASPMGYQ